MGQSCLVGWWSVKAADVAIWVVFDLIFAQISSPSVSRSVCKEELMHVFIARSTPPPLDDRSFL